MAEYGLTESGFVPKTLAIVRAEIQAAVRAALGASMDVGDRSIIGQIIGIFSEPIALVWEMGEGVNSSQDPNKAVGAGLDAICALTGTFRPAASRSAVTLTLTGTAATAVPAGSQVRTASTELLFETIDQATLVAATAWAALTAYSLGNRRTNAGRMYQCITAGTSAASGGPTTTAADITDGTVHWKYLGEGAAVVDADAQSVDTGEIVAAAGDINEIVSAVIGWNNVVNLLDATPGREQATDEELRRLREFELAGAGTSPIDAIAADLAKLDGVTSVRVFVNNSDATDADGMPPHSVECVVQGGTDQTIFDQLLKSVAAGIPTHGNTTGTATDSQGTAHTMKFSRPVEVPIYVIVDLIKLSATYEGDDAIKAAVAVLDEGIDKVGLDAVASRIAAACWVTGVLDVSSVKIGTAPAPATSTTIVITSRQIATYDTARITVNATNGTL